MARRLLLSGLCAAAAFVAGCGQDAGAVDLNQVKSVVRQFAVAHDASACQLLSPTALQDVYGGFSKSVPASRAECVKRSAHFKGEPVKITTWKIVDQDTVRVGALNPKGTVLYTISLGKYGPSWRIDSITQQKPQ